AKAFPIYENCGHSVVGIRIIGSRTMSAPYIVIIALAAGLAAFFSVRALRAGARGASPAPEALLLEEVVVTEPIAPGMEGKAELRKRGVKPLSSALGRWTPPRHSPAAPKCA